MREANSSLPTFCHAVMPGDPSHVVLVKKGEMGYWSYAKGLPAEQATELAARRNAASGVTARQVAAMVAGSMFGWNVPAADPNNRIYDNLEN